MKKTTKKRNDKTLFVAAVIVFALAVGLFVGSYARYYTEMSATGTLTAADWSFTVNGSDSTFTLDLLNGQNASNVFGVITLSGDNKVVQPGAHGDYTITLDATGTETNLAYEVSIGTTVTPHLTFTLNGTTVDSSTPLTGNIAYNAENKTVQLTLHWEWPYGDTTDNEYDDIDNGLAGTTLSVPVTVHAWQVAPSA